MNDAARRYTAPDTLVILFWVAAVLVALSFVVPAGSFEVEQRPDGTSLVSLQSFKLDSAGAPGTPLFNAGREATGFLNAPYEGMTSGSRGGGAVAIITFLLLVGGAFGMIMRTGCVDRGVRALIMRTRHDPILVLPALFVAFSLGGAIFGMSEETIAFVILLVPIVVRLGFDSITAVLITYVASRVGFASSWMNPFNVGIAQGIAEVAPLSGATLRIVMWCVFTLLGVVFTLWYARRVQARPELSPAFASDAWFRARQRDSDAGDDQVDFTRRDVLALLVVLAGVAWVVFGVVRHEYYIAEIATQFLTMGLAIGLLYLLPGAHRISANQLATSFRDGMGSLVPAVVVVGIANGLVVLMGGVDPAQPSVMNTLLFAMASALEHVPQMGSAWLMFFVQSVLNFFVPSGSGQAALTMPLMAPLGDLVGVTRQVSVLAFQLGDSLTNLIVPTSASLMGALGAARIEWSVWARFILPLLGLLVVIALVFLGVAVAIGYS
jgi:uncharacterized ion transporter superfamily protein YfcC